MAAENVQRAAIGVDLGGTSIMAAVVDAEGRVLGEAKRKTKPQLGADGVVERVSETVQKAIKRSGLQEALLGVGVGVPGPVSPETGVVERCANLGATWDAYHLTEALLQRLDLPVTVDNDVNVGAVGEFTYGAGRGTRDMLAIFVGTGLGGGLILDGKLHSGQRCSAGEVGHMVILAGQGPRCGCGEQGCAEALASRTAIEREIREAIDAGRETLVARLLAESGRSIISARIIGDAFDAGDAVTVQAVEHAQYYLGILISACVNLLDPEAVVVGGGMLERMGDSYLEPVLCVARQHFINKSGAHRVNIVPAALGDYSGAIGAAVLARQRLI